VRRLVIEGFSAATGNSFCGSEGGAAFPFAARLSVLGTAMPFCPVDGRDSGDPRLDEVADVEVEGGRRVLSTSSRGKVTVVMFGTRVGRKD